MGDRETRSHWDHITGEAIRGALAGCRLEAWPVHMTTVAAASVTSPGLSISLSNSPSFRRWLAQKIYPRFIHARVWLPPFFYLSMSAPIDPRLDKLTQGLGVVAETPRSNGAETRRQIEVKTPHGRVGTSQQAGLKTPKSSGSETPKFYRVETSRRGVSTMEIRAKFSPLRAIPASGLEDDWHGRILHLWRGELDGAPRARWLDTGQEPMQLLSRWYGFSFTYPGCEIYRESSE